MESVTKVKSLNRPRKIIRTQVRIILSSSAYLLPVQLAEREALPRRAVLVRFRGQFRAGEARARREDKRTLSLSCAKPLRTQSRQTNFLTCPVALTCYSSYTLADLFPAKHQRKSGKPTTMANAIIVALSSIDRLASQAVGNAPELGQVAKLLGQ